MLDIKTVNIKNEEEIMSSWNDKDKIVVSIVCITFNHEKYIQDALTGFLIQETNFAFEIIIHDDASTDKTTDIIREFQSQYPKIIRPIYQSENQYSKGGFKPGLYASKFSKGEYIAFCEGDDYWIDREKLQLQFDILKSNVSVGLVITDYHNYYQENDTFQYDLFGQDIDRINDKLEFTFVLKNFGYFSPMSWLMRKELWVKATIYPEQYVDGTFVYMLYILKHSKVFVHKKATAVHRVLNESASNSKDALKLIRRNDGLLQTQIDFAKKYDVTKQTRKQFYVTNTIRNIDSVAFNTASVNIILEVLKRIKLSTIFSYDRATYLKIIYILIPLPLEVKKSKIKLLYSFFK